jgi:NADH dehydrogenase/NADH:ubiquinone oxidoreductase subunit G
MLDENRPVSADVEVGGVATPTSGEDVESQTGNNQSASTSADSLTKAEIEEILGRRFDNKTEAIKTLKGLNSLVGDQSVAEARKKADTYNALVKSVSQQLSSTEEYADLYLQGKVPNADTGTLISESTDHTEYKDPVARAQVLQLQEELQKERLLKKYPEAENVLSEVTDLARVRKISLLDAYEKSSLKNLSSVTKTEGSSSTVIPTGRITASDSESKAYEDFKRTGNEDSLQQVIKEKFFNNM